MELWRAWLSSKKNACASASSCPSYDGLVLKRRVSWTKSKAEMNRDENRSYDFRTCDSCQRWSERVWERAWATGSGRDRCNSKRNFGLRRFVCGKLLRMSWPGREGRGGTRFSQSRLLGGCGRRDSAKSCEQRHAGYINACVCTKCRRPSDRQTD